MRASLEADDNDNMKNFTVFLFIFCTFAALGALAQPQWHQGGRAIGGILGHLLGFPGRGAPGYSGGVASGKECDASGCISYITYD